MIHPEELLRQKNLEPELLQEIIRIGNMKTFRSGETLFSKDQKPSEIPLVIDGLLKVTRQDQNVREVFLYYLEAGDLCAMSLTCCLENKRGDFKMMAEKESKVFMIPMTYMDLWVQKYRSFRKWVFAAYQERFEELLNTIDSISFMKLNERLYNYLLDHKQASGTFEIEKTHEQIAQDLNTSRVVISRTLKQLEQQGKIQQFRNKVEIL